MARQRCQMTSESKGHFGAQPPIPILLIAHMQVMVHCQRLQIVLKFCGGAALLDALNVVAAVSKDPVASDRIGVRSFQL